MEEKRIFTLLAYPLLGQAKPRALNNVEGACSLLPLSVVSTGRESKRESV